MSDLVLSCVVEGHGEVSALPVLLRRVVPHFFDDRYVDIPRPLRQSRSKLIRDGELERAVEFAALRVHGRGGVLVLLDADDDCPAERGPELLARARTVAHHLPVAVVLAQREYEAWFLAAAGSLAGKRGLPGELVDHEEPERPRDAKGWIRSRMTESRTYSETIDQAPFSAVLDLDLARRRSSSFDKLVRSVGSLIEPAPAGGALGG